MLGSVGVKELLGEGTGVQRCCGRGTSPGQGAPSVRCHAGGEEWMVEGIKCVVQGLQLGSTQ